MLYEVITSGDPELYCLNPHPLPRRLCSPDHVYVRKPEQHDPLSPDCAVGEHYRSMEDESISRIREYSAIRRFSLLEQSDSTPVKTLTLSTQGRTVLSICIGLPLRRGQSGDTCFSPSAVVSMCSNTDTDCTIDTHRSLSAVIVEATRTIRSPQQGDCHDQAG